MRIQRWVLASSNQGKLREFRALLGSDELEILPQSELGIEPAVESAATFIENALLKARHASRLAQCAAIADDSGLAVDALGGAPGVYSARYAGEGSRDQDNIAKLLQELKHVPDAERGARFHCAIVALDHPDDPAPRVACGEWVGRIATAPRGTRGFGYDPVFIDPHSSATAAELSLQDKNRLSHRAQALERLREILKHAKR